MLRVLFVLLTVFWISRADDVAARFCADVEPQSQVNIQHLTGMWYGIEIISHMKDEESMIAKKRTATACPVIRISEEEMSTTVSPLYENYNYNTQMGSGYGYPDPHRYYNTHTTTEDSFYDRVRQGKITENERRYMLDIKKLKILWDENGIMTQYTVRYNVSLPGLWIASGPQNGSLLEEKFNNFAGTISVLKAVGNHMVLTFCHRMPNPQLFTILLSRSLPLNQADINGVHSQIDRRGLETVSITKVCNSANTNSIYVFLTVLTSFLIFLTK